MKVSHAVDQSDPLNGPHARHAEMAANSPTGAITEATAVDF